MNLLRAQQAKAKKWSIKIQTLITKYQIFLLTGLTFILTKLLPKSTFYFDYLFYPYLRLFKQYLSLGTACICFVLRRGLNPLYISFYLENSYIFDFAYSIKRLYSVYLLNILKKCSSFPFCFLFGKLLIMTGFSYYLRVKDSLSLSFYFVLLSSESDKDLTATLSPVSGID